jgi:hypothetical protein
MYTKGAALTYNPSTNRYSNYKWQFFGIPLDSVVLDPTFYGSFVRKWVESGTTIANHWISFTHNAYSFKGYEITQVTPKIVYFEGNLVNSDYSSGQLPYTASALYPGQNILANPYTAAIDIRQLSFGAQTEWTVYLYNTGSYSEWLSTGGESTPGNSPGQYTAIPKNTAGYGGLPRQIPSMQAFLVKAMSNSADATLDIQYNTALQKNIDQQRVIINKKVVQTEKQFMTIDVKGSRFTDRMWIFSDPSCSHSFDNGWDGEKFLGSALTPQIYSMEVDGDYQINAVNDIHNVEIGFRTGEDTNDTLTFTYENLSSTYPKIYLVDLQESITIDISESGTKYPFTATNNSVPVKRFRIVTSIEQGTSIQNNKSETNQLNIYSSKKTIYVNNTTQESGDLVICDLAGRSLLNMPFSANGITALPTNLLSGTYISEAVTSTSKLIKKIIIP